jgi:hypothetical protein
MVLSVAVDLFENYVISQLLYAPPDVISQLLYAHVNAVFQPDDADTCHAFCAAGTIIVTNQVITLNILRILYCELAGAYLNRY